MSSADIERLVLSTYRIEKAWLHPRNPPATLTPRPRPSLDYADINSDLGHARTILALDVFSDRWLLCVYYEQLLEVWDLLPNGAAPLDGSQQDEAAPPVCYLSKRLPGSGLCTSSCACLEEDGSAIIVAITSQTGCSFIRIEIVSPGESDITHCTLSEAAGKVVLGTRNGEIQVL